jgi:ABC-type multidrug transport system permease subunit
MRVIWIIAGQFSKILTRDRMSLVWMLAAPCLYIFVFGSAFRHREDPSQTKASLSVMNNDRGFLSARMIRSIRSENIQIDSLQALPKEPPVRLLRIPAGFTQDVLAGVKTTLVLSKRPDANAEAEQTAVMGIRKAVYRLLAELAELSDAGNEADPQALSALDRRDPLIRVQTSYAGRHRIIPSGFSQQVPANVVQFGLIFILIYAGSFVFEERRQGLLRRIRIGPVGFGHLFTAKWIGVTCLALVQSLLLLGIGRFVFGVYYGDSPFALAMVVLGFCLCIASMGLCLGFAVHQHEKLIGIAILSALTMAALAGCWWPLEISPPWMQKVALALPSGIALRAFHLLISYGRGFGAVWPHVLGLAGYGTGFAVLFSVLLRRRQADV